MYSAGATDLAIIIFASGAGGIAVSLLVVTSVVCLVSLKRRLVRHTHRYWYLVSVPCTCRAHQNSVRPKMTERVSTEYSAAELLQEDLLNQGMLSERRLRL